MPQYDVNLRDYWRIVRKRKAIILFAAVMLGFFAMVATLLSRPVPIYRAEAKVRFQVSQVTQTPFGGRAVSYTSGTEDLKTQKEIVTSYEVLERAALRVGDLDTASASPAGPSPPNPAEITDSRRMNEFIAQVREAYDVVLFDSPPVLQATDATVLGTVERFKKRLRKWGLEKAR